MEWWRDGVMRNPLLHDSNTPILQSSNPPPSHGQTQSPSAIVLPGTPPSSFPFQPIE